MNNEIYRISLENMIPNAFIELNQRNKERITEIPLSVIEKYGYEVAKKLKKDGKQVIFCYSRASTECFRRQYQEYFTLKDDYLYPTNRYYTVILKDEIEMDKLIKKFRTYISFDLLLACMDEEVVQKGLVDSMNLLIKEPGFQKKKH